VSLEFYYKIQGIDEIEETIDNKSNKWRYPGGKLMVEWEKKYNLLIFKNEVNE
jgi:hypothetical protein